MFGKRFEKKMHFKFEFERSRHAELDREVEDSFFWFADTGFPDGIAVVRCIEYVTVGFDYKHHCDRTVEDEEFVNKLKDVLVCVTVCPNVFI